MKTQDKTTRQLAIEWIRNHDVKEQRNLVDKYFPDRTDYTLLTGREIEQIYLSEHGDDKLGYDVENDPVLLADLERNCHTKTTTLPKETVEEAYKTYKENEKLRISEFRLFRAGANWQKQKMDDYLDNDVCKAFGRGFKDAKQQSELKYTTLLESHNSLLEALIKANNLLKLRCLDTDIEMISLHLQTEINNAKQIKP